jgi:rhamnulokinase
MNEAGWTRLLPIPGDLPGYVRLACESLGEGHAAAMRLFERLSGRRFDRIVMVGGGARNRLLCQATADAAGVPLLAAQLEGSAMGNIGRQLIALGLVADVNALRSTIRQGLTIRRYDPA